MIITRISSLSGITRSLDLPVTEQELDDYYNGGLLLQDAFPNLTPDQREFIKTGITGEEWDQMFGGSVVLNDDGEQEEPQPDRYLEAAYEDRFDIPDHSD